MTVDPEQSNYQIAGLGSGAFLTISADGTISWWRHLGWQTGAVSWANNGSAKVISANSGFQGYKTIMGGYDGSLFCLDPAGNVTRFQYVVTNSSTGDGYWANNGSGVKVGTGWNQFPRVWGGPGGIIWAADLNGDLWQSTYTNGTLPAPVKVGSGWREVDWCGSDDSGVVYGIKYGALQWWRLVNGTWQNGGQPVQIGDGGWGTMATVSLTAAGSGLFYWIGLDGANPPGRDQQFSWLYLTNYKTVAADAGARWANNGSGVTVGNGFTACAWSPLQGYCWPQTVTPGGTVGAKVSTTCGTLSAQVVQLAPAASPTTMATLPDITGQLQLVQSGYRQNGCGWADSTTVSVPASGWPSGVYAVRVASGGGVTRDLPFVVKPAAPAAQLAVVLPWVTYHAYNSWAGHSQYTPQAAGLRTFGLQRPSFTHSTVPYGGKDTTLYNDILLLRWLATNGYSVDVYTDLDLHANPSLLGSYKAVITGGHPEYATDAMRQAYAVFVGRGGRLIYPGGNGLYERVAVSDDGTQVVFRYLDGNRDLFHDHGQSEANILGVAYTQDGWMTRAPYKVVRDHPLLAGTGLTVGATFGTTGFNGAASGIEYDLAPAGTPYSTVIAVGQNVAGSGNATGANMTVTERPGGGRVFAAGSLSFTGALGDPKVDQLMRNVIDWALA